MIKETNRTAIIAGNHHISFVEMLQRITLFSQLTAGASQTKTIILSENREGWIYSLFATWLNKDIVVPVDATSTPSDIAYIMNDCAPEYVWTSNEKMPLVTEALQIVADEYSKAGYTPKVLLIDDYERIDMPADTPKADIKYDDQDTALICYTSGTTGSPKGVMLSFLNLTTNVDAVSKHVPIFNEERRTLVLLPLHHVLPLMGSVVAPMMCGGGVAISPSMAAADIMSTLCEGKVANIIGVPRLWQTLFRGIKAKIDANAITRTLYNICEKAGNRTLSRTVFKSVRQKMGGHITYCVCGGAALDSDTAIGLKTLGLDVLEGYGMTETAPMICFTRPGDIIPGCAGIPLPNVEVRIIDGEICCRGNNVMKGYYNRPQETADVIDKDGFIHTGDLATMDDKGHVTITGRRKEIIVLSNGKNVNPTEIEFKLEHNKDVIKEAAVTQDGDKLCAIIVPQPDWALGKDDAQIEEMLKRDIIEPYNLNVAPYKKLMSLMVYRGDLPRTKLDKLQRFKLQDILKGKSTQSQAPKKQVTEPKTDEYRILKEYLIREKRCEVRPTDHLETDLACDSLDRISLQSFIEQTFGFEINGDELLELGTVERIARRIGESKTRMEVEDTDWNKLLNEPTSNVKLPHVWPTGLAISGAFHAFSRAKFNLKHSGLENIPQTSCIFAPNHQSYLDGMFVICGLPNCLIRRTYFYAKAKHVDSGLKLFMADTHNIIIMNPSDAKESIHKLSKALRTGKNVMIFPEGTRTEDGTVGEFKKMFAILATELNVPIVPVRISGAFEAMPKGSKMPVSHPVTVEYLPAISPDKENKSYELLAEEVRNAIRQ